MATPSPSPGPWRCETLADLEVVTNARGQPVVYLSQWPGISAEESAANVRLIAAAPELRVGCCAAIVLLARVAARSQPGPLTALAAEADLVGEELLRILRDATRGAAKNPG